MENDKEILKYIVDPETGEVEDYIYSGDAILRDKNDQDIIKNYNSDKRFVKLFDGINDLRKYLNNQGEFTTAMSLADYVCYLDCMLRRGGIRNGKKMTLEIYLKNQKYRTIH